MLEKIEHWICCDECTDLIHSINDKYTDQYTNCSKSFCINELEGDIDFVLCTRCRPPCIITTLCSGHKILQGSIGWCRKYFT